MPMDDVTPENTFSPMARIVLGSLENNFHGARNRCMVIWMSKE
jgi:hypothetical protein